MATSIGLVAGPAAAPLAACLEKGFRISGQCRPTAPDVAALLEDTRPAVCCFLTPYPDLAEGLRTCLAAGIHVLCAGPPLLNEQQYDYTLALARKGDLHLQWDTPYTHGPRHQALLAQRQRDGFGAPVYLRHICGGGQARHTAWWIAAAQFDAAVDLLGTPSTVQVNAHGVETGHCQLVLTFQTTNGANAHLIVVPSAPSDEGHLALLGTGALLSEADPMATHTMVCAGALAPAPEFPSYQAWLAGFVEGLPSRPVYPSAASLGFQRDLLASIEQSLAQRQAVTLPLH